VRQAARDAGVTDFEAKYKATLEQVKGDIGLKAQLHAVHHDPLRERQIVGAMVRYFDQAIAHLSRSRGSTTATMPAIETGA
jgi:hypothetical protein